MRLLVVILGLAGVFFIFTKEAAADEIMPDNPAYYDYSDIDNALKGVDNFNFGDTVNKIYENSDDGMLTNLGNRLIEAVTGEISAQKNVLLHILLIGVAAAIVAGIARAFFSGTTSEISFYMVLMVLICALTAGYKISATLVKETLNTLINLMNAIVPTYVVSLGYAVGSNSAMGFYEMIAIVIALVEKLMRDFILPLVYVFTLTNFVNCLSEENLLNKTCDLIKTIINWVLKALMSLIIGINVIRGMLNPVMDSIKATSFGKVASMLPGVGAVISSVSDIVLGCGTLIKNSIGIAATIAIMVMCLIPVVKLLISAIGYKLVGALLEPVSDKRIVNAVNGIYESSVILAKILMYSIAFFLITIAVVCCTTNIHT